MADLMALLEKTLGAQWRDVVKWLMDQNTVPDIEARIISGDIAGVVTDISEAASRFAAETHAAYVTAGRTSAEWLDSQVPDSLIRFDQVNSRAVQAAQANELKLVSGLSDEQRTTIRQVLVDGNQRGANPLEMARDIRSSIGLTPGQSDAVQSYRRALESGDFSNALGRELGDGRYDRTLRAYGRDGKSLSAEQVDAMTERYRTNFVAHRAETIARTESQRAAHQGSAEAIRQAIDRGDISADAIQREWNPGPRTRHSRTQHHSSELTNQRPRYGEPFVMADGTRMMHPGDPAGGALHCANCACCESTRLSA